MTYIEKRIKGVNWSNYINIHYWVYKKYGKAKYCANNNDHKSKRYEWANISGKYKKDISDWKQLCPSCHRKMDYTKEQSIKTSKRAMGNNYAKKCPIKQFSKEGIYLSTYSTIKEASIKFNILRTSIINCLNGDTKTSGGYIWERI